MRGEVFHHNGCVSSSYVYFKNYNRLFSFEDNKKLFVAQNDGTVKASTNESDFENVWMTFLLTDVPNKTKNCMTVDVHFNNEVRRISSSRIIMDNIYVSCPEWIPAEAYDIYVICDVMKRKELKRLLYYNLVFKILDLPALYNLKSSFEHRCAFNRIIRHIRTILTDNSIQETNLMRFAKRCIETKALMLACEKQEPAFEERVAEILRLSIEEVLK